MKRFSLLFLLITSFVLTNCAFRPVPNTQNDKFSFVFMTDIHVQPELKAGEGFKQAIDSINSIKPNFVITGGDLIMDALGVGFLRADSLFNLYDSLAKHIESPLYNTIGNHDVFGLYKKSGVDTSDKNYGKEIFKKRLGNGNAYSSFDHKGWHFMLLDAIGFTEDRTYFGNIDSLQMEWIKSDLAKVDKKTPIVISTHIPFISAGMQVLEGGNAAFSSGGTVGNSHKVLELFKDHNLRIVLQGHLHIVEEIIVKNVHFITAGAVSAKWWQGLRQGFAEGYAVFEVDGNNFSWKYKTYGWKAVEAK